MRKYGGYVNSEEQEIANKLKKSKHGKNPWGMEKGAKDFQIDEAFLKDYYRGGAHTGLMHTFSESPGGHFHSPTGTPHFHFNLASTANDLSLKGDKFVELDWHPDLTGRPQHPTDSDRAKVARELQHHYDDEQAHVIAEQQEQIARD